MKNIYIILFTLLFTNVSYANTTVVSGNGSATCPAGYVITGVIPSDNHIVYSGSLCSGPPVATIYSGCSNVQSNSVSGCKYEYYQDTNVCGDGGAEFSSRSMLAKIKIICAKSCAN